MAKANAINLNLADCVGFPLANATGNLLETRLNSGTNVGLGLWNGAGVWASPLGGSCGVSATASGIARYSQTIGITNIQTQGLPRSQTNGSITYLGNAASGGTIAALDSTTINATTFSGGGSSGGSQNAFFGFSGTSGSSSFSLTAFQGSLTQVPGTSSTPARNTRYLTTNASSRVVFTLPSANFSVGDIFFISGYGAGGWQVNQLVSQKIHIGSSSTTTGTGGSIASTNQYDSVELVCIVDSPSFIFAVCGKPQSSGLTIV